MGRGLKMPFGLRYRIQEDLVFRNGAQDLYEDRDWVVPLLISLQMVGVWSAGAEGRVLFSILA